MAKVAIFLCVAVFAAASNASEVEKAQQRVDTLIENTAEAVKKVVDETKQKSAELMGHIQAQANERYQKVSDDVTSKVQQASDDVAEIISAAGDVDVSECTQLAEELEKSAAKGLSEVRNCFTKNRVAGHVENLLKASGKVLADMRVHQLDARGCLQNIDGSLFALGKAVVCTNKVVAETALTAAKAVPAVSVEAAKLTLVLATLPASLATCTTVHALNTFYYDSSAIANKTTKCVQEKIKEVRDRKPNSAASQ